MFTDDGTNRMDANRLGPCISLGGGWERRDRHVSRGMHPWLCDTLLHPWSCIIIVLVKVFFIIIILVRAKQGLEATDGLFQIGALLEERDDRVGGPGGWPVSQ